MRIRVHNDDGGLTMIYQFLKEGLSFLKLLDNWETSGAGDGKEIFGEKETGKGS